MALVNSANLDVANTALVTSVNAIFEKIAPGSFSQWCDVIPASGTSIEVPVVDGLPQVREWIGPKQYIDLRAYTLNVDRRKWEATFSLPRTLVDGDKSGVLTQRISAFAGRAATAYDFVMYDALIDNTLLTYDGQALLANSHPNVNGTTADNLTTSALTFAELRTGIETLEDLTDEGGEPLLMSPSLLVVGPELKRLGHELTGSFRPVAMKNDGVLDGTSSIVAATGFDNFDGGQLGLLVSPRIRNSEWLVMDVSKPGLRPFILGEFRKPEIVALTDMRDLPRFESDEYRWSLEFDASPVPAAWQCAYGSVTA